MEAWLTAFFDIISQGFQQIVDFFHDGIIVTLRELCLFWLYLTKEWFYLKLEVLLSLVEELFNMYFSDIALLSDIRAAWLDIPIQFREFMEAFEIPAMFSVLLSAHAIRLLRRFLPFM